MDDGWVRVLRPFNSISVISRRWKGEYERLCAMKRRLGSGRISPPAGFEPATPWSEVGSANRSATRTLQREVGRLNLVARLDNKKDYSDKKRHIVCFSLFLNWALKIPHYYYYYFFFFFDGELVCSTPDVLVQRSGQRVTTSLQFQKTKTTPCKLWKCFIYTT